MSLQLSQADQGELGPVPAVVPKPTRDSSGAVVTRRVLHVINGEHYSGAERVQDLLAKGLSAEGFAVGFACLKPGKFPVARKYELAPLYRMPMRSKFDLRVVRQLAHLITQENYALVHAHTPRSLIVGRAAAALARAPLIYHVHSPAVRDSTHGWRNWVNHWVERITLQGARALIPVSQSLRQHMIDEGYSEKLIHTVPNGVPTPALKRNEIPPGPVWTLGMTALFRPRKGLEILLEALALLKRQRLPVRLRAVGPFESADYQQQIQRRVRQLDLEQTIDWISFTTDVDAELAQMDVFVLPSLFGEGLPIVVLEAMAAGVPVVATRVEGVPEAIEDGHSGLLAEPSSVDDLAGCLTRLVTGEVDWLQLRRNALQRQAEQYSDRVMAARVAEVYRRVLA